MRLLTRIVENKKTFVLLFFISLIFFHHFFCYIGFYGYDDVYYAKIASDYLNGIFPLKEPDDHLFYRFTVIAFTYISYLFFNVTDFASSLPSLILSSLILLMIYNILKDENIIIITIALTLTTLSFWFLFYSDKLMPDIHVTYFILLNLYILQKVRDKHNLQNNFLYYFLFSLSFIAGFFSKETFLLIIPFIIFVFFKDIHNKTLISFWIKNYILLLIISVSTLIILCNSFNICIDDRINSFLNIKVYKENISLDINSIDIFLKRLFLWFFKMLIDKDLILPFLFIITFIIIQKKSNYLNLNDKFNFWLTASIFLFFSSYFMSLICNNYCNVCFDPRHYLFIVPISSIPAAHIFYNYFLSNKKFKLIFLTLISIISIFSYFSYSYFFKILYLPLVLYTFTFLLFPKISNYKNIVVSIWIFIFCLKLISLYFNANKINYNKQKETFIEKIINSNKKVIVITDDVQKRIGHYYNFYYKNNNIEILNFDELKKLNNMGNRQKLLYINKYTQKLCNISEDNFKKFITENFDSLKNIYSDSKMEIEIFEIVDK